jgi:hypothetical protein
MRKEGSVRGIRRPVNAKQAVRRSEMEPVDTSLLKSGTRTHKSPCPVYSLHHHPPDHRYSSFLVSSFSSLFISTFAPTSLELKCISLLCLRGSLPAPWSLLLRSQYPTPTLYPRDVPTVLLIDHAGATTTPQQITTPQSPTLESPANIGSMSKMEQPLQMASRE